MPERDQPTPLRIRFASFEADLKTQELKKNGLRLRLPGQSFQILRIFSNAPENWFRDRSCIARCGPRKPLLTLSMASAQQ